MQVAVRNMTNFAAEDFVVWVKSFVSAIDER